MGPFGWTWVRLDQFGSVWFDVGQFGSIWLAPCSSMYYIFVGFHERRLFHNTMKSGVYFRFVDYPFAVFGSELDYIHFEAKRNLLHTALQFTVEKRKASLNFLVV